MYAALPTAATLSLTALIGVAGAACAQDVPRITQAFADHCFDPYLTARSAMSNLGVAGARVDFYDLRPFSSAPVSPATVRDITTGTDRRCEVAFDGAHVQAGIDGVVRGLSQERLDRQAQVPADFAALDGATFIAAAQLNPNRIAIVQVGTRNGADGPETFMNVERLLPLDEAEQ